MSNKQALNEFLKDVPIFKGLGRERRANVVDKLEKEIFSEGDHIIHKGETGDKFYLIESGVIAIGDQNSDITLNKGKWFGEVALLENKKRNADVYAQT